MEHWFYLNNPFETATRLNFRKAIEISTMHHSTMVQRAVGQPLIVPILDRYTPLHNLLLSKYSDWKSAGGSQTGQTLTFSQQMALAYANGIPNKKWTKFSRALSYIF